MFLMLITDV